jgi:hypothetical protein
MMDLGTTGFTDKPIYDEDADYFGFNQAIQQLAIDVQSYLSELDTYGIPYDALRTCLLETGFEVSMLKGTVQQLSAQQLA